MLRSLIWFLLAFVGTLLSLALLRYRLMLYETHLGLKNRLQHLSHEIALGYFQDSYQQLCRLPTSNPCQGQIDLLKSQCLLGMGQRHELIVFLKRCLESNPRHYALRKTLARLLLESSNPHEAIGEFNQLPGGLLAEDLFAYATALYQVGQWQACQRLIEGQSPEPTGQLMGLLADAFFQQERWQQACDRYYQAENLGWKPLGLVARKARCLMHLGRLTEAEPALREWLRAQPQLTEAACLLASCLEGQNKVKAAMQIIEAFEEEMTCSALGAATIGRCYFRMKQYSKSTHHLLNAYEMGYHEPATLGWIGLGFEKQHLWIHAQGLYQTLIDEFENHVVGYAGMAYLFAIGQVHDMGPQRGLEYALKSVELQPCLASWEILSAAYAKCGMFEKAHQIQESLMRYAQDPAALSRRQEAMRRLRQHKPLTSQMVNRVEVA